VPLGGDDLFGLGEQEVGVAGLLGVAWPAVLERFQPLVERLRVVVD